MPCISSTTPKPTKAQWLIALAYVINTFGTFWSMTGKWTNGCTNSSQSDKYFTLLTPPGWAFSIWGIIFTWELIGCAAAFLPQLNSFSSLIVGNKFVLFWGLTCLTQAVWPYIFCDWIAVSWIILLLVWVSLAALQQSSLSKLANLPSSTSMKTKVLAYVVFVAPFSLHLGWVTAAAALNLNCSATADRNTETTLVAVALCALIFVTAMGWTLGVTGLSWTKNSCDPIMAAGVLWALNAVAHRNTSLSILTNQGPTVFPTIITKPFTDVTMFVFYFLGASLLIRLVIEGVITVKNYKQRQNNNAKFHHAIQGAEEPLLA